MKKKEKQDCLQKKKRENDQLKKIVAERFIEENYPKKLVLEVVGIPRSTYYYTSKQNGKRRGVQKSKVTLTTDGEIVPNAQVIEDIK